jgi:hypothetical protein
MEGHLIYFVVNWYILDRVGMLYQGKQIWQPRLSKCENWLTTFFRRRFIFKQSLKFIRSGVHCEHLSLAKKEERIKVCKLFISAEKFTDIFFKSQIYVQNFVPKN